MADKKYSYKYTNGAGVQVNIVLSENVAAVAGWESGNSSLGKFGPITRKSYPWTIRGVADDGTRVRIPFPSESEWNGFISSQTSFNYTNQAGVTKTYKITSWSGERNVLNQQAP